MRRFILNVSDIWLELKPITEEESKRLILGELVAYPVFWWAETGKIHTWPKPYGAMRIFELHHVEDLSDERAS